MPRVIFPGPRLILPCEESLNFTAFCSSAVSKIAMMNMGVQVEEIRP